MIFLLEVLMHVMVVLHYWNFPHYLPFLFASFALFRQGLNIFGFVMDTLPSETWFLELEFTPFQPFASSNHWVSGGELAISCEGNRLVYPELPQIPKPAVGWKALKKATSDIFEYSFLESCSGALKSRPQSYNLPVMENDTLWCCPPRRRIT